jgi:hypothetical protein
MKTRSLAATIALVVLAAAPLALAQGGTKPKKKGPKPAPSASAAAETTAEPTPAPAPETTPSETPDTSEAETKESKKKELPETPREHVEDSSDTRENPTKAYYFVGLRYRGTVIPKFMVNLFVNEGATFFSNTVGAELDIRKDSHSSVVWLGYTGFGFGDTLFFQKGKPDDPTNYTVVSSSLWSLFFGLDEMWSVPMDQSHHWDFEYGFGVGLGFVFGTLYNDWVYYSANGPYTDSQGRKYTMCKSVGDDPACNPGAHSNSNVNKVNNYQEPNWFGGGSLPVIFPQIYFPSVGVRFKPVKEFEGRLGLGFSLTGFWFGISGNYGLEKAQEAAEPAKAGDLLRRRGML